MSRARSCISHSMHQAAREVTLQAGRQVQARVREQAWDPVRLSSSVRTQAYYLTWACWNRAEEAAHDQGLHPGSAP